MGTQKSVMGVVQRALIGRSAAGANGVNGKVTNGGSHHSAAHADSPPPVLMGNGTNKHGVYDENVASPR
jgi:hypothetical protein